MTRALKYVNHDVFLIPSTKETVLLYAPTLRRLLRITNKLAARINQESLSSDSADKNVRKVAELLTSSLPNAVAPLSMRGKKTSIFPLALGLTRRCTLKCVYCHADAGSDEDMPLQLLNDAIRYAFETAKETGHKTVGVSFTVGGEPSANWKLFTGCIENIKSHEAKYGIPVYLSMTTNGYYGLEKCRFIARHFQSILLSLDGPAEIQDLHRPTKSSGASYSTVRRSAKFFSKNIESFSIRSTVSNRNVSLMPVIVELFHDDYGANTDVIFEPLVPLGRAATSRSSVHGPDQKEFVKYFILAQAKGRSIGTNVLTSSVFSIKRLVTSFCGAMATPAFTVTTSGKITVCGRDMDAEHFAYGRYLPECGRFTFDDSGIQHHERCQAVPAYCADCFCKWHCAGDCPDARRITYDRCYINRSLIQHELEAMADANRQAEGG